VRRLLPLILLALLAVPAPGHAALPQPRAHATDAAAMKALVQVARKVEACRTRTLIYYDCDNSGTVRAYLAKGVLFEQSSVGMYTLMARSKQGRRFRLGRGANAQIFATCTPAGRGACPRSGIWKPKPAPVANPPLGAEWLQQERALVADLERLIAVIESCRARSGSLAACQDDPEVQAASQSGWVFVPEWRFDVQLEQGYVHGTGFASTRFEYAWLPDGTTERNCMAMSGIISPCVDGYW
jgi:hypothetical protein